MASRKRARFSARRTAAKAGPSTACRRASATATRSPAADREFHERQEETMASTTHLYAGVAATVGMEHSGTLGGIFRQEAGGGKWEQLKSGLAEGAEVHAITVPPSDPDTVFVGSTKGIYRSANRGGRFEKLPLPGGDADIWSVLVHPKDPRRIYAGASPIAVFRSDDGGDHWKQTADPALPNRVHMAFACRVMRLDVDPNHPDEVYATMAANGALSPAARSTDGSIYKSEDVGQSWTRFDHGIKADATMMGVIVHPKDPNQVYGISRVGQVFGTTDGGKSWSESRLPEGVRDCYAIACG